MLSIVVMNYNDVNHFGMAWNQLFWRLMERFGISSTNNFDGVLYLLTIAGCALLALFLNCARSIYMRAFSAGDSFPTHFPS